MSDTDQSFDESSTEDSSRYAQAKSWSIALAVLGGCLIVWLGFKPVPYQAAVWTAMFFPIFALLIGERYYGIMRFASSKRDPQPAFGTGFFFACLALFFRASVDWNMVEYKNFWMPFAIASGTLALASIALSTEIRRSPSAMIGCLFFCGFYGYGAVLNVNGMLATAPATTYHATITDMYATHGKSASYYFVLTSWGPRFDGNKVSVGSQEYLRHQSGDTVTIKVREGYLGIPFFRVD